MRILVLSNLYPPHFLGGYELTCAAVCRELRRRGHTVEVLTSTHRIPGATEASEEGVERSLRLYVPYDRPAPPGLPHSARAARHNHETTRRKVAAARPDVVFAWSQCRLTLGPVRAAQESGVPVVFSFNDEHIAGFAPVRNSGLLGTAVRYARDRWVMAGSTLHGIDLRFTTCISHALRRNLASRGVDVSSARVIYHGLNLDAYPLKEKPGEISRPVRILFLGQLLPYKGAHTLIEAAHLLAASRPSFPFRVTIVGDGTTAYRRQLESLAAQGAAAVEFRGRVGHEQTFSLYREHDVFVFPSIWQEPLGMTHMEAMASGTPVVSTVEGGPREFLVHGENALVFPAEDAVQLAERIQRLVNEPALGPRLAAAGRRVVEQRFDHRRYAVELESLLMEAEERHRQMPAPVVPRTGRVQLSCAS